MSILLFFVSLILVSFGQPAWIPIFSPLVSCCGYALFWISLYRNNLNNPNRNLRSCFWAATFWFSSVQAIQLSWMATTEYMGFLILPVYGGLVLLLALQFSLLSLFVLQNHFTLVRCGALAGLWVLFEWSRLFILSGFTWDPVGLSLAATHLSLQWASLFGIFGLSFWVIFVNLLAIRTVTLRTRRSFTLFLFCALLPYVYGFFYETWFSREPSRTLTATMIQTALLPEERDHFLGRFDQMIPPFEQWEMIMALVEERDGNLFVLPEGTLPFFASSAVYPLARLEQLWHARFGWDLSELPDPKTCSSCRIEGGEWFVSNLFFIQALSNHTKSAFIVGLDEREHFGGVSNSAFYFVPGGDQIERTMKRILMPIAEYIPFKNGSFFARLILKKFGIEGSFEKGTDPHIFSSNPSIGVSICYEETFSEITRQLRSRGADLLVTISNDVWFLHSKLGKQHFAHGMIRSVENGTSLLRATNWGITGAVDCFGSILALAPEQAFYSVTAEIPLRTIRTPYSWWGDSAVLSISVLLTLSLFRRRPQNQFTLR